MVKYRPSNFLTASPGEISNAGYNSDGPLGQCWSTGGGGRLPLHRLNYPSTTDHVYTVNESEYSALKNRGWHDEGVTCYIYLQKAFNDLKPLYRMYGPHQTDHLYTQSAEERDHLTSLTLWNWTYEGVAGYLY